MKNTLILAIAILSVYGCAAPSDELQSKKSEKIMNFNPAKLIGKWQCEQIETSDDDDFSVRINLTLDYRSDNTVVSTYHKELELGIEEESDVSSYKIEKVGTWEISRSLIVERTNKVSVSALKNIPDELIPSMNEFAQELQETSRSKENYLIKTLSGTVLKTNLCPICTDRYREMYEKDELLPGQSIENVVCNKL